jgi:hypothetical protein
LVGNPGVVEGFTIDGQSALPGSDSTAIITPDGSQAIYQLQHSPVAKGGNTNVTLALDLQYLNTPFPFATESAADLLVDPTQVPGNIDTAINDPGDALFNSFFNYYVADASGNVSSAEAAYLTTLSVSVPEPASLALLVTSLIGFGAIRSSVRQGSRR